MQILYFIIYICLTDWGQLEGAFAISAPIIAGMHTHHVCTECHVSIRASAMPCGCTVLHREKQIENAISSKIAGQRIRHAVDKYMMCSPGNKHARTMSRGTALIVQHHLMYVVPGAQAGPVQAVLEYT